jgi:YggT family protein
MQDPVAGLISFVIMLYIALLFVRQFAAESERYDAVLGMIFRATDPVVSPVQNTLPSGNAHLAPALVLVALLLLQGILIGSIPYAIKQFADKLLQLYVLIIIIMTAFREYYTNPIASFCQRIVSPVRALATGVSQHVPTVNLLSVAGLVVVHSMVVVVLNGLMVEGFDDSAPFLDAFIGSGAEPGSLLLILNLTQFFTYAIIANALLSWVSPNPLNPIVQLLTLIANALLSWVSPNPLNPIVQLLTLIALPIMEPLRRVIPPLGGAIDISPIIAILALQFFYGIVFNLLTG